MDQTLKNDKKPNLGPDFGPNQGHQFFFAGFTSTSNLILFQAIIQCNYKGKVITKLEKIKKTPNFGPDFGLFGPNLGLQIFFEGFTSTGSQTLFQSIIQCNLKEN